MSNCTIKFNRTNSKEINNSDLFMEDFLQQPNVSEARELTDKIFSETIRYEDLAFKAPGGGLKPYEFKLILNKKLKKDIKKDEQFHFKLFK